jgi:hypothetical protein
MRSLIIGWRDDGNFHEQILKEETESEQSGERLFRQPKGRAQRVSEQNFQKKWKRFEEFKPINTM